MPECSDEDNQIDENDDDDDDQNKSVVKLKNDSPFSLNFAFKFWSETLKSSKHILAPMVDQSELAFRLLCRKYDVHCTYSPMFNSGIFVKDIKYQRDCLQVLPEQDRPLIIQFCANKPETFLEAVKIAEPYCDAIDLNLGCPQTIARRGHYGAFLQDEWNLIYQIVNLAAKNSSKPITCKIRVFKDVETTIKYAKMIENAGASLLTVHGRVREQKGPLTGLADWKQIKAVKENIRIPVFANGNIQSKDEVERCFKETNVDGIMSAEGLLYNPSLFTGKPITVWDATNQYIELSRKYPCPFSYIRGHVFKFFHHLFMLKENEKLRHLVAKTRLDEDFLKIAKIFKERYEEDYKKFVESNLINNNNNKVPEIHPKDLPIFFCKPYYRPAPTKFNSKTSNLINVPNQIVDELTDNNNIINGDTNDDDDDDDNGKQPVKKLKKIENKQIINENQNNNNNNNNRKKRRIPLELCVQCSNPKGTRCDFNFCRPCCRKKTFDEKLNCDGHCRTNRIKKPSNFLLQ